MKRLCGNTWGRAAGLDFGLKSKGSLMSIRPRPGFTLIETIAAITILAVAIPPMLWAVQEAQIQRVNPMLASKARWLATEKLEDIIADRHSDSGSRGYDYLIAANYAAQNKGDITGYEQFSRTVTIDPETDALFVPTVDGGYKTVTVSVGWDNATGNAMSLAISTVLTEYTP